MKKTSQLLLAAPILDAALSELRVLFKEQQSANSAAENCDRGEPGKPSIGLSGLEVGAAGSRDPQPQLAVLCAAVSGLCCCSRVSDGAVEASQMLPAKPRDSELRPGGAV